VTQTTLAATAKRLIEKHGRTVTLYRSERTPANASQPWRGVPQGTAPEDTMGPVAVAFVPPSGSGFGKALIDEEGQLTKAIDQVGLLAADSVAALSPAPTVTDPARYDRLVDGVHAYRIVSVGTLAPGTVTMLYVLGLKS